MALVESQGKVTYLRVSEPGDSFGPVAPPDGPDYIQAEVIVLLDTEPQRAFGFNLLNDRNLPIREGYLDLLREAFDRGWLVKIDSEIAAGKTKGRIQRLTVTKPPRPPVPSAVRPSVTE